MALRGIVDAIPLVNAKTLYVVLFPLIDTRARLSPLYALSIRNTEPRTLTVERAERSVDLEVNAIPISFVDSDIVFTPKADREVPIKGGFPVLAADKRTVLKMLIGMLLFSYLVLKYST